MYGLTRKAAIPNLHRKIGWRQLRLTVMLSGCVLVGGCSVVPDWANPVEWYDNVAESVSGNGDSKRLSEAEGKPRPPGEDRDYPNLSQVPDRPQTPSTAEERQSWAAGLAADRANARYTDPVPVSVAEAPPPRREVESVVEVESDAEAATSEIEAQAEAEVVAETTAEAVAAAPENDDAVRVAASDSAAVSEAEAEYVEEDVVQAGPVIGKAAPSNTAQPVAAEAEIAPTTDTAQTPTGNVDLALPSDQQTLSQSMTARIGEQNAAATPYESNISRQTTVITSQGVSGPGAQEVDAARNNDNAELTAAAGADGVVETIFFANGSAGLSRQGLQKIRRLVPRLREDDSIIRIVGHASRRTRNMDFQQHKITNFNISFDRAQTVANALSNRGIAANRIRLEAMGDRQPRYQEIMPDGEAQNRRVEIFIE